MRASLGKTYLPLINGEYVPTNQIVDSLNPSNPQEVVGRVGILSIEQAEQALQSAKEAFSGLAAHTSRD